MNLEQALGSVRQIFSLLAVIIGVIAILKLFGINVSVRAGITELAAVGILCALVGR